MAEEEDKAAWADTEEDRIARRNNEVMGWVDSMVGAA